MVAYRHVRSDALLVAAFFVIVAAHQTAGAQTRDTDTDVPAATAGRTVDSLTSSFDALERAWLASRFDRTQYVLPHRVGPDVAPDPSLREQLASGSRPWSATRRSAWTTSRTPPEPRVGGMRARISKALESSNLAAGEFSVRSAASASKAQARQAIVNALARTPLGRALGRVFYIRHDDEEADARDERPSAWSKAIPLLNPRLNARTRTVGVTFVWRF